MMKFHLEIPSPWAELLVSVVVAFVIFAGCPLAETLARAVNP